MHMVELRQAVYKADEHNTDVAGALQNLQAYVTTHMNTNLNSGATTVYPPIQLKYTYERLLAQGQGSLNGEQLYAEAQRQCEAQNSADFSGRNRVPCIEQYVQTHGGGAQMAQVPDALYKFDFVSPKWSPDLAGWSLVVAVLSWLLFIVTWIANRWLKRHSQ